jgi:hypothetical protein
MPTALLHSLRGRLKRLSVRKPIYFSTLTCPHCHRRSHDQMPSNASVYFYYCLRCNQRIKPKPGTCCVYCSYGDIPCPPVQRHGRVERNTGDGYIELAIK